MKRILQYTMALILAGTFLVSFTGVRLLVHHCMGCGTSELVFASNATSCCLSANHSEPETDGFSDEAASCCAIPNSGNCGLDADHHCCDFEVVYLKGDFQLTPNKVVAKIEAPVMETIPVLAAELPETVIAHELVHNDSSVDPPPRLTGKSFVIFSHQIKIALLEVCVLSA